MIVDQHVFDLVHDGVFPVVQDLRQVWTALAIRFVCDKWTQLQIELLVIWKLIQICLHVTVIHHLCRRTFVSEEAKPFWDSFECWIYSTSTSNINEMLILILVQVLLILLCVSVILHGLYFSISFRFITASETNKILIQLNEILP